MFSVIISSLVSSPFLLSQFVIIGRMREVRPNELGG